MASLDEREYCKLCMKWFAGCDAFTLHKIQSKAHIACFVCGRDFKTQEGCTRHQQQEHAAEQKLSCVGCNEKFTRAGAYISHIEQQMCPVIHKEDFDRRRDEKQLWHKSAKRGDRQGEELPSKLDKSFNAVNENTASWESWGIKPESSFDISQDFPVLPTTDYRNGGSTVPDLLSGGPDQADLSKFMWNNNEDRGRALFPNSPDAVKPPADLLAALNLKQTAGKNQDCLPAEYDPDHPDFDPSILYNPYTEKYNCPWLRCKKIQNHVQGLKQHLKSPAHMDEKLRCPGCLRIFNSATALVQHAESQAVKCNIRESEKYRQAVDQITGGFIDALGRHDDNTIKYVAPKNVSLTRVKEAETKYWARLDEERKALLKKQEENVGNMKW